MNKHFVLYVLKVNSIENHITFLPMFLPEAEERLAKGDGRERPSPFVGEGVGRVCDPPDFPPLDKLGIPPPPTPRVPLMLPLPDVLTRAVCKKNCLAH